MSNKISHFTYVSCSVFDPLLICLQNTALTRCWFKQDDEYLLPKGSMTVAIRRYDQNIIVCSHPWLVQLCDLSAAVHREGGTQCYSFDFGIVSRCVSIAQLLGFVESDHNIYIFYLMGFNRFVAIYTLYLCHV